MSARMQVLRRCRQFFNGESRFLSAEELMLVFEMCGGLDYVTPILQREALRAEDAAARDGAEKVA